MQIQQRKPSAVLPSAGVDVIDIAELGRFAQCHVPVHHGAHVSDGPGILHPIAVYGPQAGVFVFRAEGSAMDGLPIVVRKVGMDQPDDAVRRFHLDRQRQGPQACCDACPGGAIAGIQPSAAMGKMVDAGNRVVEGPPPGHQVMVAADGMEPGPLQPRQDVGGFRPAIHEIAHGEQSVAPGRESDGRQRGVEAVEMAVDVAYCQVAAPGVQAKAPNAAIAGLRS